MSSHILNILRRKPKTINLSNEEKVKALSDKAIGLFDHMKKAHDDLGAINNELQQIVEAETQKIIEEHESFNRRIKQLETNREKALDEIQMNGLVQGELAKFIR